MPGTLAWQRQSLDDSCQSGKKAAVELIIFHVHNFLSALKYRVKYYDYIVNWCSLIYCNWCVSLDIAQMLALNKLNFRLNCWQRLIWSPKSVV